MNTSDQQQQGNGGGQTQLTQERGASAPTTEASSLTALRAQVILSLAAVALAFFTGPWPVYPDAMGGTGNNNKW